MIETQDIIITKATQSKIDSLDLNNIPFGRYFTDHMLIADYANGEWGNVEIKPYQAISFDPSMAAIHYGQAIFEGVKAYKTLDGKAQIFRPEDNYKRFNISAKRMEMPAVPEEIFMGGMKKLIEMDKNWIPAKRDYI